MTISYELAPIPKWYIADLTGKPLGGGYMATYLSPNKTVIQLVFQDPGGNFPWPYVSIPNTGLQGILFDENGSQGPFYWQVDTSNPQNTYYVEVYDSNGVLQWTIDDFGPTSGGGGSITTSIQLENLVVNNVMFRNLGASANPVGITFLKLAPGPHEGLTQTISNAGPDIVFIKNNLNATDQLQFINFTSNQLNGDITPAQYLNYACTNTPSGELQKMVQFPITQNVWNLNNQQVTITIWARCNSGANLLPISWYQFFGDGSGASPATITPITTFALTTNWSKFQITTVVPPLPSPLSIGPCGNSGLFLQVNYPLGAATNIDFTKLSLYIGNVAPAQDFYTYDMIASIVNSDRTGFIKAGYDLVAPFGYLLLDDGTIGSPSSGATSNGGLGANANTFPLYNWLWNNVSSPSSNSFCPVTGGLGASAIADFSANKTLQLQYILGSALASKGLAHIGGVSTFSLGQTFGEQNHTLTINEMPSHNHAPSIGGAQFIVSGGATQFTPGTSGQLDATTTSVGGGAAHNITQPTAFVNFYIKL